MEGTQMPIRLKLYAGLTIMLAVNLVTLGYLPVMRYIVGYWTEGRR